MKENGKGDINYAYHMNIYDEYDYRHTDEQTEAYNIYIQQLHDSNTTLEQAEEMLGNILGDVERFATDERSQLIGQSDALQDYITELERQKENERAEAENSAEVALRDAIADLMRKSGLDVLGHEVGQRVLDEANGRYVRLSAKQKRALETATIADESTNNATVVSSAAGACGQQEGGRW